MTRERGQVGEARHQEDRHVAAGALQDLAHHDRDEHAAHRARHAAEAHHRAHGPPREHVGGQREEVGRPALVRGRRQARPAPPPPTGSRSATRTRWAPPPARTPAWRSCARAFTRPAALDERRREPAAADAAHVGHEVDDHERQADGLQVEAVVAVQEVGDPEEVQPPDGVGHELADREGPGLAVGEQLAPGDGRDRLRRDRCGCRPAPPAREPRVLLGRPVEPQPPDAAQTKPVSAGGDERPLPAPVQRDPGHDQRASSSAPTLVPELKMPVARARSFFGNHSATVLIEAGKLPGLAEPEEEPHQREARGRARTAARPRGPWSRRG